MAFDSPRKWEDLTPAERCRSFADELEAWEKMGAVFPDGAKWDFTRCETCAMGYAVAHGKIPDDDVKPISDWLGISRWHGGRIFIDAEYEINKSFEDVTPSDVARLLREHADTLDG